ncbi:PREDICTED: inner centromere protein A isoform X1 [Eufriesea mexicana]|uniref:inner centromere protein A isoform X1 n=1 Tax=Eufriesea mexicana TaxID=516756 RepID=UPI00083C5AF8|nr:PREDICTED: inner centromere protein A isoform X1 [Eufriesea mexicana]
MFVVLCLLLILSLGHCQDNDLPSRFEIESSINRTIEEVERQVREDSSLPQLSRQEIVNILQNITSRDLKEFKDKGKFERARNLYQRALMVVLPYSAEESSGNLKDLFTKPPMTQMIPDFLKSETGKNLSVEEGARKEDNDVQNSEALVTENLVLNPDSYKTTLKESTTMKNRYKNHRDTYSEVRTKVPLKETLKLDSTPVRFSFNLENLQKNAHAAEKTTTMKYPIYRGNESNGSELEIIYSTSVTDEPTTKSASKEITIDLEKIRGNQNILTSSQWRYNAPPITTKPTLPSKLDKVPFLPTIISDPEDRFPVSSTQKSEVFTKDTRSTEVPAISSERPTALYVTPMSTETSSKVKYSSTYSLNSAGFRQATPINTISTTTSMPVRSEVMDLLASIGLRPDNNSNVEDVYKKNKDILESKVQVPDLNSIQGSISGLTSVGSNAVSIVDQNTFETTGSEIKKGVKNLTPDVQMLFQRFGLQTSNLDQSSTTTTQKTTVNLNSYTNFKPLPTSSVKDQEMREFLAKFGLGVNNKRKQKSMKASTEAPSVIEAVPHNMRGILENIGLISNSQRASKAVINTVEDMESTETSKFHVFKPHEVTLKDENQRNKINELLDTVKQVQEGKADIQKVRKVANDLLKTTKILKDGPDPLKLEEIIKTYNENVRNEVKRQEEQQQEATTTTTTTEQTITPSSPATESAETTLSTSTTTDSARAASDQSNSTAEISSEDTSTTATNLMALEESFGGTTKEPDPVLPPRRKSGLYFLVDWNSFLEVGEEDKEKINLRFQPKVGDRSRFLPVTVP